MSEYIHKSHNVSVLMYHFVCPTKYRRVVLSDEVDATLNFPACFAFSIDVDSGFSLVFMTLPNIFNSIPDGRLWGSTLFIALALATFSTVLIIFANIITFAMELTGCSRRKAAFGNLLIIMLILIPCVLGFNTLSHITPLGEGSSILVFQDFLVSSNIAPLSVLGFIFFCTRSKAWGWDRFLAEVNSGDGLNFPRKARFYLTYIMPVIIIDIFILDYLNAFNVI